MQIIEDITVETKAEWIAWARAHLQRILSTKPRPPRCSISSPDLQHIIIVDHERHTLYRCRWSRNEHSERET